jgi:hypothetical protein
LTWIWLSIYTLSWWYFLVNALGQLLILNVKNEINTYFSLSENI